METVKRKTEPLGSERYDGWVQYVGRCYSCFAESSTGFLEAHDSNIKNEAGIREFFENGHLHNSMVYQQCMNKFLLAAARSNAFPVCGIILQIEPDMMVWLLKLRRGTYTGGFSPMRYYGTQTNFFDIFNSE